MRYDHRPGDPWSDSVCAVAGTTLEVRLEPAGGYRWTTIASAEPELAEVTETGVNDAGTATGTVTLRAAGTATLSATTSYAPDRHGPPTRLWRLTVTIESS